MTNTMLTSRNTTTSSPLRTLAGAALIAAPLLMVGGMLTSPPQADDSDAAYVASLARDWDLSILSANLFHYAWVLLALAVPAVLTLLRGRRGRALTTVGVVLTAFGAVQMSGLLFADWMNAATPAFVSMEDATAIFAKVGGDPSLTVWRLTGVAFGVVLPAVMVAGLARNGVVGWWAVPVSLLPFVAGPMVSGPLGSAVALVCYAPFFLIGARLLRRAGADVAAAESAAGPAVA